MPKKHRRNKKPVINLSILKQYCYRCRDKAMIRQVQRKYAIPRGMKYLLGTGELPEQNLCFAIEAFIGFIRQHPDSDLFFVITGLCSDEQLALLHRHLSDLSVIQYHLVRIGPVAKADLAPLMGGAFAFVYPSVRCDDCLPVLEALACGCPIIYSDTPVFSMLVGDNGIRVNPHHPTDLIDAYNRLYTDKKLRHACIRNGLKRAEALITLAQQAGKSPPVTTTSS